MKKIIYLSFVLPLLLISCVKNPEASFSTTTSEAVVGQDVIFNNNSHNATHFAWDFGDGTTSSESNPTHKFNITGSYDVMLTAISKSGKEDKATLTLNVVIPTILEIEVREYYSEDLIPGASVILYPSIGDWDAQTHMIGEGFTDTKGDVVFANLDPFTFYVDVWEQTHDNYTLRSEDYQTYIQIPTLLEHEVNWFVAWVDVADHTSGSDRGARPLIIKKLERRQLDKSQFSSYRGTETWQELYERRVK